MIYIVNNNDLKLSIMENKYSLRKRHINEALLEERISHLNDLKKTNTIDIANLDIPPENKIDINKLNENVYIYVIISIIV